MQPDQLETLKVYFEVTNYCNFCCDFCPTGESRRKPQHMDWALLTKGLDEIASSHLVDTVGFHILGEPLLYPRILDAIRYAKRLSLHTEMNTNGSLLTRERAAQLAEAGLDELYISVQVLGEEEHKCRGTAMPFETYYRRVMEALSILQGGATKVVVCAMDTSTRKYFDVDKPMRMNGHGEAFRDKLARLVLDTGAAVGQRMEPGEVRQTVGKLNLTQPKFVRVGERLAIYAQPFADWGNAFTSRKVYPAKIGYCGYGLSNVGILSNGQVTLCCADYDGKTALGNLRTQSLADILASPSARAIRQGFAHMKLVHPYCQRCIGSTNPIKSWVKALGSIYMFKVLAFQPSNVKEIALGTTALMPISQASRSGLSNVKGIGISYENI